MIIARDDQSAEVPPCVFPLTVSLKSLRFYRLVNAGVFVGSVTYCCVSKWPSERPLISNSATIKVLKSATYG